MSSKSVPKVEFIGYMGMEIGKLIALYNVGENTWSTQTLKEKGIKIPKTPTFEEWETERRNSNNDHEKTIMERRI